MMLIFAKHDITVTISTERCPFSPKKWRRNAFRKDTRRTLARRSAIESGGHEAADFVVSLKTKCEVWKTLRQYFEK
jgi:hypothetical protein